MFHSTSPKLGGVKVTGRTGSHALHLRNRVPIDYSDPTLRLRALMHNKKRLKILISYLRHMATDEREENARHQHKSPWT